MGGCTRVHRGRWGRDGWHRVTGGDIRTTGKRGGGIGTTRVKGRGTRKVEGEKRRG